MFLPIFCQSSRMRAETCPLPAKALKARQIHPASQLRKHAGLFPDDEILGFDNQFFGIPGKDTACWAPCLRLCLEKCYESLQLHGYTKETVQGQSIALYNGHSEPLNVP